MAHFDYENAKRDILDAGGDPDYLSHYNESSRDRYLDKMGLNPSDYGDDQKSASRSHSSDSAWQTSDNWQDSNFTWATTRSTGSSSVPVMTAREEKELMKFAVAPEEMRRRLLICAVIIGLMSFLEIIRAVRDGEASAIIFAGALIALMIVEWTKLKKSAGMRRELVRFVAAKQAYEAGDIEKAKELMQEVDSSLCGKYSETVEAYRKRIQTDF